MILNTGGRTDTVQYYSEWLLNRFREGYVLSRNPLFPEVVNRIELSPETLDVVVFCSKDYSPILPRLHEISDRFNCYYHYTITAYGTDIEPRVPSIEDSIRTLKALAAQVGSEKIAWRYDPVLLTEKYTIERHLETFDRMARELAPYVVLQAVGSKRGEGMTVVALCFQGCFQGFEVEVYFHQVVDHRDFSF